MPEQPIEELEPPVLPDSPTENGDPTQQPQPAVSGPTRGGPWNRANKSAPRKGLEGVEKKAEHLKKVPLSNNIGAQTAKGAGKEVSQDVGKTALKVGGKVGSRLIPVLGWAMLAVDGIKAVFSKKFWTWAICIVAVILVLLAIPFGLLGGTGSPQYPSTQSQIDQTTLAASIGGDFVLSGRKVNEKVLEVEKKRYAIVQRNVDSDKNISGRSTEVKKSISEILTLIELGINMSGKAKEKQNAVVIEKIQALDSTLPFGEWIASFAKAQVGKPNKSFCTVTKAPVDRACASFVTTVLQNAGIPSPEKRLVDEVWGNPATRLIVSRQSTSTAGYFQQNEAKLQPGDIIFWGTGSGKVGRSKFFNHVGFYVGGGKAIDTSSKLVILERPAASRGRTVHFNGAKRYGKDL